MADRCIRIQPVATHCCDGTCQQGRRCPLVVPRVSPLAGVPVQLVTGGPVPRRRRAAHFCRALWRFLTDRKVRL